MRYYYDNVFSKSSARVWAGAALQCRVSFGSPIQAPYSHGTYNLPAGTPPGSNWTIKVYDEYNTSNNGTSAAFTIAAYTSPPVLGTPSSVSTNQFDIGWTGASTSRVDVATDAGFTSILSAYNNVAVSGNMIYATSGILPGTSYWIRVRSTNGSCTSNSSTPVQVTTLAVAPSAPVLNTPYGITSTAFNLSWPSVSTATSYSIELSTSPSFSPLYNGAAYTTAGTSYPLQAFLQIRHITSGSVR